MMEQLRQQRLGYWLALGAALIAVIGMIIFAVYQGKGGEGTSMIYVFALIGIVLQIALFFYDGKLGDFLAIGAAVLYVLALGYSLEGGVGNITDAVSNIVLFGIAELARDRVRYQRSALYRELLHKERERDRITHSGVHSFFPLKVPAGKMSVGTFGDGEKR